MENVTARHFHDEDAARAYLEAKRWPDGPVCPHCGVIDEAYKLTPKPGSTTRKGLWKCAGCRKQFTVTVGTVFADSKLPLHKWLFAVHLLCASKKGMSAHQLHRMLGITYKSAWFMAHRIRYAMQQEPLSSKLDGVVEVDETYIGGKIKRRNNPSNRPVVKADDKRITRQGPPPGTNVLANKAAVVSLVQRGGRVRSVHMERVTSETLKPLLSESLAEGTHVITDSSTALRATTRDRWRHDTVNHTRGEYVRYEGGECITTNTVESFFNILKRGVNGTYHHLSRRHLHRYLSEFDFRYNSRDVSDTERATEALQGAGGKRLMYRDSSSRR